MLVLDSLIYLDVERTGSQFLTDFFRRHVGGQLISYVRHGNLEWTPPTGRVHVISVRDPVDQYLSLFSYGCQGRGLMWQEMEKRGHGGLYRPTTEGFAEWLDFVLDPRNAPALLMRKYGQSGVAPFAGLMSFRVARMAVPKPVESFREARSYDDFARIVRERSIVDHVLRTETLTADLAALVRELDGRIDWTPSTDAAYDELRSAERRNASERVDKQAGFEVPGELVGRIRERERLLVDEFGYSPT